MRWFALFVLGWVSIGGLWSAATRAHADAPSAPANSPAAEAPSAPARPAQALAALTPPASVAPAQASSVAATAASSDRQQQFGQWADEIERHWKQEVLPLWFPRCVDREHGGFRPHFLNDWTPGTQNDRTVVFQSRMTWVAAQVAMRYPELRQKYTEFARHGMQFLTGKLWDAECGGFYWALDSLGQVNPDLGDEKHVYGIAFAIYASAAAYELSHDERDLELAQRAFAWLEHHAHDERNRGYYEALSRTGDPILAPPAATSASARTNDMIGTAYGYKSMNTHIHLLEALTALHHVWPDPAVAGRLSEVHSLVRDTIAVEPGCLHLYFTPDWRPVPDHDSFGHDLETGYLLLESAAELRMPHDERTQVVARSLVDHALAWGWDSQHGGFYDRGSAFSPAHGRDKIWWTQAEGLNVLLVMHERFGRETERYLAAFHQQREFIWRYQIDHQHGEWYEVVSPGGQPETDHPKGSVWKAAYHNGRALMNVADILRRLASNDRGAMSD